MIVLTVNAGSSSIRLAALDNSCGPWRRVAAYHNAQPSAEAGNVLPDLLACLGASTVDAVAHRVVHGGKCLVDSCVIDAHVETEIERLVPLAPLHNPASLAWIHACRAALGPDLPHVAVFDTAFYAGLPDVSRLYALPRELSERLGLRRFGFHGVAHQGMLKRWRALEPAAAPDARVISLQLGSGCSITASRGGVPVDTSMGFSPLAGLMMATRSGDIDPGLLLHLQRELSMTPQDMDRLLNCASGLLGVSGISGDMRTLLASDAEAARLATDMYCYRARKYVGAYIAVLGGVDAVLFGGGIGENAPLIRERILTNLHWAGIEVDPEANSNAIGVETCISTAAGAMAPRKATVWTLAVDEAVTLADEALRVLRHRSPMRHTS